MTFYRHLTLKGEMPEDIYPWLFQRGRFERPRAIFSTHSVKPKP